MGIIFCHQWHPQFGTWAVIVLIVWPLPHLFCVFCFFIFFFFISSPSLKHILHLHTHTCTHTACLCVWVEKIMGELDADACSNTHTHRHNSTRRTNSGNNSVIPSPHPSSFDLISPSHHCSPSSSPSTFIHFYPSILLSHTYNPILSLCSLSHTICFFKALFCLSFHSSPPVSPHIFFFTFFQASLSPPHLCAVAFSRIYTLFPLVFESQLLEES